MDFLSWQLDFLYMIQCFRDTSNHILDNFFIHITTLGEALIPISLTAIIYWCINKKTGMYLLWSYIICYVVNIALKVTACIQRPWVLDSRIHPVPCAIHHATGYSFPSGHTAGATSIWGSLAVANWGNKGLRFLLLSIVVLVMLSRCYLGVHTPQDVIVSFIVGMIVVTTIYNIQKGKWSMFADIVWLILFTIICILLGSYVCTKAYPYCALYNPEPIKADTIARIGFFLSVAYGWFIEKHFIKFDPQSGGIISKILKGGIGLVILYGLYKYANPILATYMPALPASVCAHIIIGLFITAIHPWFIKEVFR